MARPTVANRLHLLELPEEIQVANQNGSLSERQCLALAPVVQLRQSLNGQSGDGVGEYWNRPSRSPAEYIQAVIKAGDATSDDIRDYARRALSYAGEVIPKCIAKHEFACPAFARPPVKAASCASTIPVWTPVPAWLPKKKAGWSTFWAWPARIWAFPSVDFLDFKHEHERREALRAAYENKLDANFVIGRQADGGGVRPYRDENHEYLYQGEVFGDDGRNGIVIGTRGPLPAGVLEQVAELTGETAEIEDIPDRATRDAWEKEANKYQRAAVKAAREALVDKLYASLDGDVIQAFMYHPDSEWIDDHEKLVDEFVKFMWDKGRGIQTEYDAWPQMAAVEQLLSRAGLVAAKVLTTGSLTGDLRRRAVMALTYWYRNRHYAHNWNMEKKLDALTAVFAEFETAGPWADEEMSDLHRELGRAMDDVEMKMEKEAEDA